MIEAERTATGDRQLKLKMANRRDAIEPARRRVLDFLAPHGLGETARYRVELVLEETLVNVVSYAFDEDTAHEIDMTVLVDGDEIVVRIEDDGIAFDPRQVAEPLPPTSIEEAVPGGLGIKLVRAYSRSLDYRRIGDRNELTVRIARN